MATRKASISDRKAVGADLAAVLEQDQIPWHKKSHLRLLNFCIVSMVLFSSANGYDGSMMNGLQALPQWQDFAGHPTGAWLGFINAAQALGSVCGYAACAYIIQNYGRKSGVWVGYVFLLAGTLIQTAAPNMAAFVTARILVGVTSAFFSNSVPLLITEGSYPTQRGTTTALYNCGWYVGSLLAAWITFGTRNYSDSWAWRIPSLLQCALPVVAFPGFFLMPESPRWMVAKGSPEKAREMLVKYHTGGVNNSPLVEFEMSEIENTLRMEREAHATTGYSDMLKTKGNRHRLFISVTIGIFAQWNGVGVVSYYLALVLKTVGITSVTNQTLISGCLQIWNLIIAVGAAFCVDAFGRRKLFMISCLGMLTSYVIITGLSGSFAQTGVPSVGTAVIPFLFLYYGSYDIAFTPLIVSYTCEIWPYRLRARGLSVCLFSTMLAVFFNIFVNPIALESIGWKYYLVFVFILVGITLTCYFFYPETRGHTLEEMAVIFDGAEADVASTGETLERVASISGKKAVTDYVEKL